MKNHAGDNEVFALLVSIRRVFMRSKLSSSSSILFSYAQEDYIERFNRSLRREVLNALILTARQPI
jgi:hypothetical protein